jgi:hypothetical protein
MRRLILSLPWVSIPPILGLAWIGILPSLRHFPVADLSLPLSASVGGRLWQISHEVMLF